MQGENLSSLVDYAVIVCDHRTEANMTRVEDDELLKLLPNKAQ